MPFLLWTLFAACHGTFRLLLLTMDTLVCQALESFLKDVISQNQYSREEDQNIVGVTNNFDEDQTKAWMFSSEAGSLRRLWESSRLLAKRELEEGIGATNSTLARKRITLVVLNDLISKALARGMSPPLTRHSPSIVSVSRVLSSLGPNGDFQYTEIGAYISRQQEELAYRAGTNPEKSSLRIIYNSATGALSGFKDDVPEVSRDMDSLETLRECLAVRAYSMEVAGVATVQAMSKLTALYEDALTQLAPEGYRNPTLREVLKCDRLLLTETLGYLSQGQGTMDDAVLHFCGTGRRETPQFDLLKVTPHSMPCKGTDLSINQALKSPHGEDLCRVCQEPRRAHKGGRWCKNPSAASGGASPQDSGAAGRANRPGPNQPSFPPPTSPTTKKVAQGSSKRAAAGVPALVRNNKKTKIKSGNTHMLNCLQSSPSDKRNFCFDFHNRSKGCKSAKCQYSHRCPYNVGTEDAPQACDERHALYDHK